MEESSNGVAVADLDAAEVNPHVLYDAKAAARFLDMDRDSVYEIPDDELEPTWVGPKRGRKKFKGSAIIRYIENGSRRS